MKKQPFMNFTIDHTTMLFHPKLYIMSYVVFRIIFGATPEDLLYEKKRKGENGKKDVSMTFATRIGEWEAQAATPLNTIFALVQPSEPENTPSHVRTMLNSHDAVAHVQHIALRTPDLIAFHKHCVERGVQFVTPILKDDHENLIQVFSGEWFLPGGKPSGFFFEFLQRDPSDEEVATLQKANKQSWFRDETFLGLYDEKEREYQSGNVLTFFKPDLFEAIMAKIGDKQVYEITEQELEDIERMMIEMTAKANKA